MPSLPCKKLQAIAQYFKRLIPFAEKANNRFTQEFTRGIRASFRTRNVQHSPQKRSDDQK